MYPWAKSCYILTVFTVLATNFSCCDTQPSGTYILYVRYPSVWCVAYNSHWLLTINGFNSCLGALLMKYRCDVRIYPWYLSGAQLSTRESSGSGCWRPPSRPRYYTAFGDFRTTNVAVSVPDGKRKQMVIVW